MKTPEEVAGVMHFEFTAKVRLYSFLFAFVLVLVFFLAMPTTQLSAVEERLKWDNRCLTEVCQ